MILYKFYKIVIYFYLKGTKSILFNINGPSMEETSM